jgi:hypothetical protein
MSCHALRGWIFIFPVRVEIIDEMFGTWITEEYYSLCFIIIFFFFCKSKAAAAVSHTAFRPSKQNMLYRCFFPCPVPKNKQDELTLNLVGASMTKSVSFRNASRLVLLYLPEYPPEIVPMMNESHSVDLEQWFWFCVFAVQSCVLNRKVKATIAKRSQRMRSWCLSHMKSWMSFQTRNPVHKLE